MGILTLVKMLFVGILSNIFPFLSYKGVVKTQIALYKKIRSREPEIPEDDLLNVLLVSRIESLPRVASKDQEYRHYESLLRSSEKTLKDVIWAVIEYEYILSREEHLHGQAVRIGLSQEEILADVDTFEVNVKRYIEQRIRATGIGTNASHTHSTVISDNNKRIEIGSRDAKASDNSGIAHMKNQRILVIDDNPHIHKDWKQLLEGVDVNSATEEDGGFEIDSAFQGKEGLDKIRQALLEERHYVMVIVDIRMPPGWDGVKTIEHIWKVCPELHIVICAAYSDYTWPEIVERLGRSEKLVMLKHPFNDIEVQQFAIGLAEKVGCKSSARIEISLKRMAESMRPGVRCC